MTSFWVTDYASWSLPTWCPGQPDVEDFFRRSQTTSLDWSLRFSPATIQEVRNWALTLCGLYNPAELLSTKRFVSR
jgi:hypothetical protein